MRSILFSVGLLIAGVARAEVTPANGCLTRPLNSLRASSATSRGVPYAPHFERFAKQIEFAHVIPPGLPGVLTELQNGLSRSAAREVAVLLRKIPEGRALYTENMDYAGKAKLRAAGVDERTWNFLKNQSKTQQLTLFRDAEHLSEVRAVAPNKCLSGECQLVEKINEQGYARFEFEHEGVRYRMLTCVKTAEKGCKSLGETRSLYPVCGPGVSVFKPLKFFKAIERVAAGLAPAKERPVTSALEEAPCS